MKINHKKNKSWAIEVISMTTNQIWPTRSWRAYLVSQLVGDHGGDQLLLQRGRLVVDQQAGLPEGDQTPVLHGTRQEVWDGHQV